MHSPPHLPHPPRSRAALRPELVALTALGALVRFWRLFTPNAVVFDEHHYIGFAGHYFTHTYYYDVHPPLAKLLYAAEAALLRIPAATLIHVQPAPALRLLPALCGTLVVPLVYVLARQLGGTRSVASMATLGVALDNALVVEMRLILLEPLLICFGLAAIVLFLAARCRGGAGRWALLVLAGVFAGAAAAVKWTGLSALAVVLGIWCWDTMRARRAPPMRGLGEGAILATVPALVYVAAFAVHFALLPNADPRTHDYESAPFRATLVGDPLYDAAARMSFVAKLIDVHREMQAGNHALERVTNAGASPWYTWPTMKHPIGYWEGPAPGGDEHAPFIILLGNPVVWWAALAGGLLAPLLVATRRDLVRPHGFAFAVLGWGVIIDYVPFMAITRLMYLYHYLFALVWLVMLAAFAAGAAEGWQSMPDDAPWRFPTRFSRGLYVTLAVLIAAGFAYFAPLTYGLPISTRSYAQHFWMLHPRSRVVRRAVIEAPRPSAIATPARGRRA